MVEHSRYTKGEESSFTNFIVGHKVGEDIRVIAQNIMDFEHLMQSAD